MFEMDTRLWQQDVDDCCHVGDLYTQIMRPALRAVWDEFKAAGSEIWNGSQAKGGE